MSESKRYVTIELDSSERLDSSLRKIEPDRRVSVSIADCDFVGRVIDTGEIDEEFRKSLKEDFEDLKAEIERLIQVLDRGVVKYVMSMDRVMVIVEVEVGEDRYDISLGGLKTLKFRKMDAGDVGKIAMSFDGEVIMLPDGTKISKDYYDRAIKMFEALTWDGKRDIKEGVEWFTAGKNEPVGLRYRCYMAIIAPRIEPEG